MTRREFAQSAALALSVAPITGCMASDVVDAGGHAVQDPNAWMNVTPHLDWKHPSMMSLARELSRGRSNPKDRALAAFHFVRDSIKFGFARGFWDQKASDVLASGIGYCNPKSTLLVALLRGLDIPARQVFVDIDVQVLSGLLDPGTPYVDHSYVEVWIEGGWRATDAYIVDLPLFERAQARTKQQNSVMGWGVHSTGVVTWDGTKPAFAQYNLNDFRPLGTKVWGVFEDVGDFYRRSEKPWNKLNPALRLGMGVIAAGANATIERVRIGSA